MPKYDVIVVGAGPAGSTAAYFLGLHGVRALMIDKGRFPRDKPCGGGISARLLDRFPYLVKPLESIPVRSIRKVYLQSPGGVVLRHETTSPLYLMVRRYEFDHLLFKIAQRSVETLECAIVNRVEVTPESATVCTQGGDEFDCQVVIGADGANSIVARVSGLRQGRVVSEYAIDMMEETPYEKIEVCDRECMYVYYAIGGHYGYGYVFPKAHHLNLGIGYKLDYYLSRFKRPHYSHQLAFIEKLKQDDLVKGNSEIKNFRAFPIPVRGPLAKTYAERVLLCGDAAGFVNAFTAEGIYYAMVSGQHAAATVIRALQDQDFSGKRLGEFQKEWKAEIGLELEKSVSIQDFLLSDPRRIDRIVNAARSDRRLACLLTSYATGAMGYGEFKRAMIFQAFPVYVWHKIARSFRRH